MEVITKMRKVISHMFVTLMAFFGRLIRELDWFREEFQKYSVELVPLF
jgi:hypothetical protein